VEATSASGWAAHACGPTEIWPPSQRGHGVLGDDMGSTADAGPPDVLRRYVHRTNKKMGRVVHRAGKLSCFTPAATCIKLMDDLIDAWASTASTRSRTDPPRGEVYRPGRPHRRDGGVDMDLLAAHGGAGAGRAPARSWRSPARRAPAIAWAPANTANYIPVHNYLAMLDEGVRWNQEHFGVACGALLSDVIDRSTWISDFHHRRSAMSNCSRP